MRAIPSAIAPQVAIPSNFPKSLFQNGLPVTYLESIFCEDEKLSASSNHSRINILQKMARKNVPRRTVRKSLFGNILPAKYLESIFYGQQNQYPTHNQHRINVLGVSQ
jgi:hypothetical protein